MIYCIEAVGLGFKVGYTGRTIDSRIADLQTGCPVPLTAVWSIDGDRAVEKLAHRLLEPFALRGEWFSADAKSAAYRLAFDLDFRAFVAGYLALRKWQRRGFLKLAGCDTSAEFVARCAGIASDDLLAFLNTAQRLRNSGTVGEKRGRKPLAIADRRRNLGLQLSPAERAILQAAADAQDKPLSVFIRDAALAAAGHKPRRSVAAMLDQAGIRKSAQNTTKST